jgi:hypothetical protein
VLDTRLSGGVLRVCTTLYRAIEKPAKQAASGVDKLCDKRAKSFDFASKSSFGPPYFLRFYHVQGLCSLETETEGVCQVIT